MSIKVNIENFKEFQRKLEKIGNEKILKYISNQVANSFLRITKKNTPVDTGYLRKRWHHTIEEKENEYIVTVYTNVEYAPYVNDGHRIVKDGNQIGYYAGQFFLEKSVNQMESKMQRKIKREVKKIFKEIINDK